MTTILFIGGAPGVGKTSLVRRILGARLLLTEAPEPKWTCALSPAGVFEIAAARRSRPCRT